ncbi:MAG: hypothetical protein K1X56_04930 [Flavobacteriales bacterium]|nr:hypothetical protein [Flavobacteriales bacterium]
MVGSEEISRIDMGIPEGVSVSGDFGRLNYTGKILTWSLSDFHNPVIDLPMVRELISVMNRITRGEKSTLLIDLKNCGIPMITPTAKAALLGSDMTKLRVAIAFSLDTITRKTVFLNLVSFNKFNIPLRAFESEQEANNWLSALHLN